MPRRAERSESRRPIVEFPWVGLAALGPPGEFRRRYVRMVRTLLFLVVMLLIAAGALALRISGLGDRPMHADEGNQAVRTGRLMEEGHYEYSPEEHHGPSLYWIALPIARACASGFAQTDETTFRIVPVLFGTSLILLLLLLTDGLGRGATLMAALLTALSPAMVYYSRYYIQEMLLVAFTLAAIGCGWRYVRRPSVRWAAAFGACVGLMHATKETWVLAAAALGGSLLITLAWARWRDGCRLPLRPYVRPAAILVALLAATAVSGAFFSSFGDNPRGPLDSLWAFSHYWRRGTTGAGDHAHPWHFYFELLFACRPARGIFWTEGLIGGLALVGVATALLRRQCWGRTNRSAPTPSPAMEECGHTASAAGQSSMATKHGSPGTLVEPEQPGTPSLGLARFLAFYTILLTALYSALTYKTPWCVLGFLDGMVLLAGVGAATLLRRLRWKPLQASGLLLLALGCVHLGRQTQALNGRFAADPRNPWVYAHTSIDLLNLAALVERLASVSSEGHQMVIHVVASEDYWPLPWYLRRFEQSRVGYWRDVRTWSQETASHPPPSIVVFTSDLQPAIEPELRVTYNQQSIYGLRPGVLLAVYVRDDVWQAFLTASQ